MAFAGASVSVWSIGVNGFCWSSCLSLEYAASACLEPERSPYNGNGEKRKALDAGMVASSNKLCRIVTGATCRSTGLWPKVHEALWRDAEADHLTIASTDDMWSRAPQQQVLEDWSRIPSDTCDGVSIPSYML